MISSSQPRTYLVPEEERTKPLPPGFLPWIRSLLRTPDLELIRTCGMDAYFFLRYLSTLLRIFVPLALVIIPILVPLNIIDGKNDLGGIRGLDRLSWANVGLAHTGR
jgi:calcium permeable stress-gated cation channel